MNNHQKGDQNKNLKIFIFLVLISISLGAGYYFKANLKNNSVNSQIQLSAFEDALTKGKEASILTQTAQSPPEWQQVSQLWQDAIAILNQIPQGDQNYTNAQTKLREYEKYLDYSINNYTNPPYFRNAVNHGMEAANLSQNAKNTQEWEKVAQKWNLALTQMKNVPVTDPNYDTAQKKVVEYQLNLETILAQNPQIKLAQQTPNPEQPHNKNIPITPEFREGVNEAMKAAILTQKAKNKQQWQEVSQHWQNAIEQMKKVPANDPKYTTAQAKVTQYQTNLNYAQAMVTSIASRLTLIKTISGKISPKSVVFSGKDLFFAQNMMYQHTITVYNRQFKLVKTIPDTVKLSDYGYKNYQGEYKGSPVEVAFSEGGQYAWVSNYEMYGSGFNRPGDDVCSPAGNHDHSYLYKINTNSLNIEKVIKVGAVPKYVAVSPNHKYTLVSNWCSYDLSIVDQQKNTEVKRIYLGAYPRGIVVDSKSQNAYVAVMGSFDIAKVNLNNFQIKWFRGIGSGPRHLVIDPEDKYLYVTLNGEGQTAKIDLTSGKIISKVVTGAAPRSMAISDDGKFLYIVNYNSNTISKVRTMDMKVLQTVQVNANPIGITYDPQTKQVWVACYSGTIMIFQDGE